MMDARELKQHANVFAKAAELSDNTKAKGTTPGMQVTYLLCCLRDAYQHAAEQAALDALDQATATYPPMVTAGHV